MTLRKPGISKRLECCSRCGSLVEVPDGASLREVRKKAGLGLRELARRIGLTPAYLSDVELNRRRVTPKMEVVYDSLRQR